MTKEIRDKLYLEAKKKAREYLANLLAANENASMDDIAADVLDKTGQRLK
jgi:hypothetical protein